MKVNITQYKWAGAWGPFSIKIPCGECGASEGIIEDMLLNEFKHEYERKEITFTVLPWLNSWWKPLLYGGWHAPLILVNDELVSQGTFIDRGQLAFAVRKELVRDYKPESDRNIIFSKPGCQHCKRSKEILDARGIPYEDRNIIVNPLATHQLFYLCKQFFPKNRPITVPQIWFKGTYFGDSETLINAQEDGTLNLHLK